MQAGVGVLVGKGLPGHAKVLRGSREEEDCSRRLVHVYIKPQEMIWGSFLLKFVTENKISSKYCRINASDMKCID